MDPDVKPTVCSQCGQNVSGRLKRPGEDCGTCQHQGDSKECGTCSWSTDGTKSNYTRR